MIFASARDTGRIPVIAILGKPGSGKTLFLNHLLSIYPLHHSVVLSASEDQYTPHEALRLQKLDSVREAPVSECFCCGMRSGLGDALRDLFLRALTKKIPPVDRVIIEANISDPGPLKFTLKHAPFLGQRYVFDFTILLLDIDTLSPGPVDLKCLGVEHADYVVFSNALKLGSERHNILELAVKQLNPKAKLLLSVDKLEPLLANKLHYESLKI